MSRLAAEARKQFLAPNSVRKTGVIMACGYQRCPAAATIYHHNLAPKASEIDRRRQSRWSAAYDEAVKAVIAVAVVVVAAEVAVLVAVGEYLIGMSWNGSPCMSMSSVAPEKNQAGPVCLVGWNLVD
jgi:uncharacterized membrane protein YdfJ with MMPL/SSD domain